MEAIGRETWCRAVTAAIADGAADEALLRSATTDRARRRRRRNVFCAREGGRRPALVTPPRCQLPILAGVTRGYPVICSSSAEQETVRGAWCSRSPGLLEAERRVSSCSSLQGRLDGRSPRVPTQSPSSELGPGGSTRCCRKLQPDLAGRLGRRQLGRPSCGLERTPTSSVAAPPSSSSAAVAVGRSQEAGGFAVIVPGAYGVADRRRAPSLRGARGAFVRQPAADHED